MKKKILFCLVTCFIISVASAQDQNTPGHIAIPHDHHHRLCYGYAMARASGLPRNDAVCNPLTLYPTWGDEGVDENFFDVHDDANLVGIMSGDIITFQGNHAAIVNSGTNLSNIKVDETSAYWVWEGDSVNVPIANVIHQFGNPLRYYRRKNIAYPVTVANNFSGGTVEVDNIDRSSGDTLELSLWGRSQYTIYHSLQANSQYYDNYFRVFDQWQTGGSTFADSLLSIQVKGTALYLALFRKQFGLALSNPSYVETGSGGYYLVDNVNVGTSFAQSWLENSEKRIEGIPPSSDWRFLMWGDGSNSNPRQLYDNFSSLGVFKMYQASSSANATAFNNQRKMFAHTFNGTTTYYQVYESSGEIWLSSSTGGAWENEIRVSNGSGNNYNPSIDVYSLDAYNIYVHIVWVNSSSSTIYFRERHWYNGTWTWGSIETVSGGDPGTGYNSISWTPVVSGRYIAYNRYYNNGSSGSIIVKDRQNTNVYVSAGSVPGSNQYCKNPSLMYYTPYGHIAYESSANIYYSRVAAFPGDQYEWGAVERVSPSAWTAGNFYPSLTILYSGTPAVAWRNINDVVESGSSVCERMRVVVTNGEWQNAIQSYSYGTQTDVRPTLGGKTGSWDMSMVWSDNGTVTRGYYTNYSWSSPTVMASGSNGGTFPNITPIVNSGVYSKAVWRKSNWQLSVQISEPTASVRPGPGPGPVALSVAGEEETPLRYRWNRHGLVDFGKAVGGYELAGQKTTTPPQGTLAFEVAKTTYGTQVIQNMPIVDTASVRDAASQYRSKSFVIDDGTKSLTVAGAVYGLGLSVPQELLSQSLEPLGRITLRDAQTQKVLKTIAEISPSELSKTWTDTFGSYAEYQADLSKLEGMEVFVQVDMIGSSSGVNPVIVDDYYITENPSRAPGPQVVERKEEKEPIPSSFALYQNYPNPFNPVTQITFDLPSPEHVTLTVFDVLGKEVLKILDAQRPAGRHTVGVDFTRFPSGTYVYRITAGAFSETKRLMLIK